MGLSYDIISEFVKVTNGNKEKPKEGIVYATIVQASDGKYVKIDGSDLLTPTDTTTDIEDGERVTVMIKDHRATVTGNVTAPSASGNRVDKVVETVTEQIGVFETVVADKVSVNELEAYKATIENLIVGKADIEDLEATNAVIENLKVKDAEIENAIIDKADIEDLEAVNAVIENLKVKDAEIENLVADKATINDLNAVNADIQNLKAQHAHIEDLVADKADIEDLEATNAEIENLKVKDAEIENLVADKATIEDLEATKAEIEVLDADFAEIKTLVSGNLTSDNILSFNITADKVTMEDAFIKDAMIDTVNAAKINAGRINTNSVVIGSEDGGMRISGATQQFTDKNGNVRIQIGRDTSNDFTFALYGEDGQGQIINQNGITASAIADGLIVNDMVSDNAAISGGKLDISSVVTEINNDNTTTIKSNKIYLDEQNQSLEVAFKSLKTQVDTIKDIDSDLTTITDKIQSNTSKIEANKSSISTLLAEDAAIKKQVTDLEGNVVETTNTLTSKYTSLQQNLDGFKTTVNNTYATKTSVNDVKNNLSSNYSTTSAMNSAINQKVDEITASVSSTYATKNEVKTIDNNIKANYSTTEQMSSAISVAKNEINLGISQVYETKTEVTNKVGDAINKVQIGGRNLIIRNTETKNYYIGMDGSLSKADGYGVSDYIKVDSGESLAFSKKDSPTTDDYFRWAWYGNDKTYMNRTPDNSNKFIWVVPSGAAYVRISYPLDCYPKVERGTKHTDWTPAPEDVDTSINNAITTSKNYTDSQIKISKDAIELGVSQTYETKTSVTSQISNTLKSAKSYADTKKSEAISTASSDATSKANNALNSAKSYADTKKSEAITSANNTLNTTIANYYTKTQTDSQIKVAKDAINLGVSETYETKTNVISKVNSAISTASSDATSKANNALSSAKSYADTKKSEAITSANNTLNTTIANYYTKTQTDSQIKVAKDAIDLSVKSTYETKTEVANKINAIQIGGRNLIIRNTETKNYYIGADGSLSKVNGYGVSDYIKVDSGESLAFSKKDSATTDDYFRWAWYGNDKTYMDRTPNNSNKFLWTVPSGAAYVRISYPLDCYPKVERGTKHTDWSPAPEDIDNSISNAITESNEYTDSQIKISKDAIELGVSQTYETKSSVSSQISSTLTSAKSYADAKKSEAISTASSDATTKANNALSSAKSYADTKKTEAINSANSTLNTTIANYYTKTQTDSQIKVAKDAINLGVSQTYETKTNVTSKVNSAISTASSDATSKANNALSSAKSYADTKKSEAITSANNTLNSTIANYYTKAQTDSQIKIAKDSITSSVSSTYETKTNVSALKNQINQTKQNIRCNDLGVKINYSDFSTANAGELYLHGYDSNNNPTNTNGKIYWNGATLTIVKGMINPNSEFPFNTDVYIFVNKTTSSTWIHGCYYNTSTKAWAYKSLIGGTSSATSWTPDQNHVAIGVFNMSEAEAFNHAYLFETPQSLLQLTVGSDNLASRMNTAEQKITDSAIVSTVTSSTTYKNNLTGKVDKTTIISSINQTAESVKINASKIELTGSVVVNAINGGSTLINGSKIQTGTITANMITSGTFQGTNFIAGGSSNGNGYFQVKDSSNDVKFHASKDGVYATKIQFPDSISISGSIIQSGNISASSSGFTTSGSESGSLYRMEYNSNLGPLGLKISSQYYNTEGGGNVAGTKKTIDITGDTIGFRAGSSYAQLSQSGTNVYSRGGYDSYNGYYCDGTMSLKKASHGGIDVGNTSTGVAICSKTSPTWWNGSTSYTVYTSGSKPTPADIGAAKALVSANGYQGMTLNDGSTSNWIRTTTNGLLPSASSGSSWPSSSSSLGTSSWRFSKGYVKEMHVNGLTNDLGDIWLTAKAGANTIYAQAKWLCPATSSTTYLGSSGYRWHSVWAANGTIQTSDERFKVKQGFTNIDDCFEMIKNTDIYNYIMLNKSKEKLSKNRLGKMAMENSKNDVNIHIGIMAQDIQKYECSKGILIESEYEKEDGTTDTLLGINAYGLATAVMGGLKKEIQIRNEQYECLKRENEELKTRLANIERMLTRTLD